MTKLIDETVKKDLTDSLVYALPILRAQLHISQDAIAQYVGISRQTYCALESRKARMSWNIFLSLFLFFISNEATYSLLKMKKGFIGRVCQCLQYTDGEKEPAVSRPFPGKAVK